MKAFGMSAEFYFGIADEYDTRAKAEVANRRRERLGASGHITSDDVVALLLSQRFRCRHCFKAFVDKYDFTVDHVQPLSRGGRGSAENVQLLCLSCNCRKADRQGGAA